jgi:hypothetical protein
MGDNAFKTAAQHDVSSRSGYFTPGAHWTRGRVGPRAGLDFVVAKKKICCPYRESNHGRLAHSLLTELPGSG